MADSPQRIAYFVSSHGFGHAARAASIMLSLGRRSDSLHFDIFTEVPAWFFAAEGIPHRYHTVNTDVGLVQTSPLAHDNAQTLAALDGFVAGLDAQASAMADILNSTHCHLVLCDISPLGIAAARKAGIPAVLIENFTWDWIYEHYAAQQPAFNHYIEVFRTLFHHCDYLIQTEPVCDKRNADLVTAPISRTPRQSRAAIRRHLGVPATHKLITITMGGVRGELGLLEQLTARPEYQFILPGTGDTLYRKDNCLILPQHSALYHPDLINASDLVIGKLGYSTLAEVYYAGVPFIYVARDDFRESACLAQFVDRSMPGMPVPARVFANTQWLDGLPGLMASSRPAPQHVNGAETAADFIYKLLGH